MEDVTKAKSALAAKGFIFNDQEELLIVKRRSDDVHNAGAWEVPGGRLEVGEDPIEGMKRETKEEVGLEIEVQQPLEVRSFTRDDGQHITMIIFRCKFVSGGVSLSEEHTEFAWKSISEAREQIHPAFGSQIDTWETYYKGR